MPRPIVKGPHIRPQNQRASSARGRSLACPIHLIPSAPRAHPLHKPLSLSRPPPPGPTRRRNRSVGPRDTWSSRAPPPRLSLLLTLSPPLPFPSSPSALLRENSSDIYQRTQNHPSPLSCSQSQSGGAEPCGVDKPKPWGRGRVGWLRRRRRHAGLRLGENSATGVCVTVWC
jgi:hypothetical protein